MVPDYLAVYYAIRSVRKIQILIRPRHRVGLHRYRLGSNGKRSVFIGYFVVVGDVPAILIEHRKLKNVIHRFCVSDRSSTDDCQRMRVQNIYLGDDSEIKITVIKIVIHPRVSCSLYRYGSRGDLQFTAIKVNVVVESDIVITRNNAEVGYGVLNRSYVGYRAVGRQYQLVTFNEIIPQNTLPQGYIHVVRIWCY